MSSVEHDLRTLVLVVLLIGAVGTVTELALLGHYEERWQWAPLVVLGLMVGLALVALVRPGRATVRTLRGVAAVAVLTSLIGLYMHYRGNVEFELEMYPSREGLELFWEAMRGATPALAPGALALIGLLGLVYTFRHPVLRTKAARETNAEEHS